LYILALFAWEFIFNLIMIIIKLITKSFFGNKKIIFYTFLISLILPLLFVLWLN
jgi:hypothetical protein